MFPYLVHVKNFQSGCLFYLLLIYCRSLFSDTLSPKAAHINYKSETDSDSMFTFMLLKRKDIQERESGGKGSAMLLPNYLGLQIEGECQGCSPSIFHLLPRLSGISVNVI